MQAEPSSSTIQPSTSSNNSDDTTLSIGDFIQTGRTGRRNAVPDILNDNTAKVSTSDLSTELEKLTCSDIQF